MEISHLKISILTQTALCALQKACEECSDKTAKESIVTALKAITTLNQDIGKHINFAKTPEYDGDDDPSEYCAAV